MRFVKKKKRIPNAGEGDSYLVYASEILVLEQQKSWIFVLNTRIK